MILILGATGATGRSLVKQLLDKAYRQRIIVRNSSSLPDKWKSNELIDIVETNVNEIEPQEMEQYLQNCHTVVSCLGHGKVIWGHPRRLVTDSVKLINLVITSQVLEKPIRFILMNTSGYVNKEANEVVPFGQKVVLSLLRVFLPPHADNEDAANYLSLVVGQNNPTLEWVVVRPDDLVNEDAVTPYELHNSPTRSAIFNAAKVSRINVANFMMGLVLDLNLWSQWKGKMPVIYKKE